MASHHQVTLLIAFIVACFVLTNTVSSRDIFVPYGSSETNNAVNGTKMRVGDCWTALCDVKTCSDEISAYFKDGSIDIGDSCCQAIKTVTRECWRNLLAVVGISIGESYVLQGYCDASDPDSMPPVNDPGFYDPPEPTLDDGNNGSRI